MLYRRVIYYSVTPCHIVSYRRGFHNLQLYFHGFEFTDQSSAGSAVIMAVQLLATLMCRLMIFNSTLLRMEFSEASVFTTSNFAAVENFEKLFSSISPRKKSIIYLMKQF